MTLMAMAASTMTMTMLGKGKEDDDNNDVSSNPPNRLICLSWTFASGAAQTAARLLSRHLPSIESKSNIIVVKWKKAGNDLSPLSSCQRLPWDHSSSSSSRPDAKKSCKYLGINIIGNGVKVNFNMKISTNLAS